jgi:hypothetical protein
MAGTLLAPTLVGVRAQSPGALMEADRELAGDLTFAAGDAVTAQSLIADALNKLLWRNGRPPVGMTP